GMSHPADRDPDGLSGLDRELAGFVDEASRIAELAGVDSSPGAHRKQLSQESEASLGAQAGGGAIHELDRLAPVAGRIRRKRQDLRARRVLVIDLGSLANPRR